MTPEALLFVADLARRFSRTLADLLERRRESQARYDEGWLPAFLESTRDIREAAWAVAPIPADLLDRRVEITGPADAKMIINGLNSGASVFMADFEDALSPTWDNLLRGQGSLIEAVAGTLRHVDPATGKAYALGERRATLMVRPRGWHLLEKHLEVDGRAVPAALFDFGLFFFHNARALVAGGTAPYFYLPKLQGHLEARLWNEVFVRAQEALGLARGTVRATVLIETLPAAFEMDEILYELREHSAGLNCGRWDYIFSFIKTLRADGSAVFPDRSQVTMDQPCMRSYARHLVRTCHRRGAHAMGGMAAQIPVKDDPEANRRALDKVRADKVREVTQGHDGTWVAHPGLVAVAREAFEAHLRGPHQIDRLGADANVGAADLLHIPRGTRSEAGLRQNVRVGVRYLEAWLGGTGCVPLFGLMEDAATAEISRTQIWQWMRHGARLDDGRAVSARLFQHVLDQETAHIKAAAEQAGRSTGRLAAACGLFERLVTTPTCADFLTVPAYELLLTSEPNEEALHAAHRSPTR